MSSGLLIDWTMQFLVKGESGVCTCIAFFYCYFTLKTFKANTQNPDQTVAGNGFKNHKI